MDDIRVAVETCPFCPQVHRFDPPAAASPSSICYSLLEQDIKFHAVHRAPLLQVHLLKYCHFVFLLSYTSAEILHSLIHYIYLRASVTGYFTRFFALNTWNGWLINRLKEKQLETNLITYIYKQFHGCSFLTVLCWCNSLGGCVLHKVKWDIWTRR